MRRILSAAVLVPLLYLYVSRLGAPWFHGLISLAGLVALYEFFSMMRLAKSIFVAGLCVAVGVLAGAVVLPAQLLALLVLGAAAIMIVRLFADGSPEQSIREVSATVLGLVYIPGLLTFQMSLRELGVHWIFALYISVWAADSFALYTGTLLGKHKLYPTMSPNKTIEGGVGSLVGGALAMLIMNYLYGFTSYAGAIALGMALSVAAQIGDLVESMFKRDAGVKDSGAIVPGHGGLLDKLDAALLAAPILFLYVKALK